MTSSHIGDDIRSRVDIVDVVSRYVDLRRSWTNFVWLSPFRQEKTPSFVVSPHKQIFKDFGGNGLWGDVITFLMEVENIDFMDAVRILAKDAGIRISDYEHIHYDKKQEEQKEKQKRLQAAAQDFFSSKLWEFPKALDYVTNTRGLWRDIIEKFCLGYAPDSYYDLVHYLLWKGFKDHDLLQWSLAKISKNWDYYAFFRDRLIIPIFDKVWNTVAFGGRALSSDTQPKYINSSDTSVYDKSKILYGLNFLKDGLRLHDFVVVVEWYMDVIAWSRLGYDNAVATCGTSLTEHHVKQLKNYSNQLYFFFDSDEAWYQASLRALKLVYKYDIYPKIITLPEWFKDIDELVNVLVWKEDSKDIVEGLLQNSLEGFSFLINRGMTAFDVTSPVGRKSFLDLLFDVLAHVVSPTIQHAYLDIISKSLSIEVAYLLSQFRTFRKKNRTILQRNMWDKSETSQHWSYVMSWELLLCGLCWQGYLLEKLNYQDKDKFVNFLSDLIEFLPETELLRIVWYDSVEDNKSITSLNESQLWREKELSSLTSDRYRSFIIQTVSGFVQQLLKQLAKSKTLSAAEFVTLQTAWRRC